jgi:tetratricopeptide (TPR) repeat protein
MTIAALILPFALFQAAAADATSDTNTRFQQCVALIESHPDRAYEDGMAWSAETHSILGYRCAAMALVAEHRYDEAARRFQSLATALSPDLGAIRAELFSQAGNTYLLDHNATSARSAFTLAIVTVHGDPQQTPDLLIDRARAYAMEADFRHAEEDLTHALDVRPNDALALRLRATARMEQSSFDLAETDAQAAVRLEPTNVDNLLVLGNVRESKRTGSPVATQ